MIEPYVGRYYSTEYISRQVLRQRDQRLLKLMFRLKMKLHLGILPDPNQQMLELEQGSMGGMEQGQIEGQEDPAALPPAAQSAESAGTIRLAERSDK